jgi:hypothetical protein
MLRLHRIAASDILHQAVVPLRILALKFAHESGIRFWRDVHRKFRPGSDVLLNCREAEHDEWIKTLPDGKKVRYSYQLLTAGFSASAEILEPAEAAMVFQNAAEIIPVP